MATHETGEYAVDDMDATSLHTHHEGDEDGHSDGDVIETGRTAHVPSTSDRADADEAEIAQPRDEEAAVGGGAEKKKKKYELQDQTNLLPVKQVIVIFCGLNCALFCSLLEQTM